MTESRIGEIKRLAGEYEARRYGPERGGAGQAFMVPEEELEQGVMTDKEFEFFLNRDFFGALAKREDTVDERAQLVIARARALIVSKVYENLEKDRAHEGALKRFLDACEALKIMDRRGILTEKDITNIIEDAIEQRAGPGYGPGGMWISLNIVRAITGISGASRKIVARIADSARLGTSPEADSIFAKIAGMKRADKEIWHKMIDKLDRDNIPIPRWGAVIGEIVGHPDNKDREFWLDRARGVGLASETADYMMCQEDLSANVDVDRIVEYYLEFYRETGKVSAWHPKNTGRVSRETYKKLILHESKNVRLVGIKMAGGRSI